jgi:hypothetical protein
MGQDGGADGGGAARVVCPDRLAGAFESLGDKCEFGLAQRFCGIEPLSLFRFSTLPHEHLMDLLETRLAGLEAPGALSVFRRADDGEWWGRIASCGMEYHTARGVESFSEAEALALERERVGFLRRRLLKMLEGGGRVFLRRDPGRSEAEARRLLAALRRYGAHDLLWVDQAFGDHLPGAVDLLGEGFARGFLGEFRPNAAPSMDGMRVWLAVLENGLAQLRPDVVRGLRAMAPVGAGDADLQKSDWRFLKCAESAAAQDVAGLDATWPVMAHHLVQDTDTSRGLVACCEARRLVRRGLYVVSAWVWVPMDFAGWIGMSFPGLRWVQMWAADLAIRGRWQRIATSVRSPGEAEVLYPGLVAVAPAGSRFYSAGWRLERGVVPDGKAGGR